jgi:hypothetical protein
MALVRDEYCTPCGQRRRFINGKCSACVDRKRREELAVWLSKTTEEKLLDLHRRVQVLEAGPPRY